MKKTFILLFVINIILNFYSTENNQKNAYGSDDKIVEKIAEILIKEYDNYKDKTLEEKFVLSLGKKTFIESVGIWTQNYNNVDSMKINLNYHLDRMSKIAYKNIEPAEAGNFEYLLTGLTRLGFKNLQLYFNAVKSYLSEKGKNIEDIDVVLIDDAICNPVFFEYKKKLYQEERNIKKEILDIMLDKRLRYKIGFYIFAFNFLNRIREKIIDKDIARMENKIKNKS